MLTDNMLALSAGWDRDNLAIKLLGPVDIAFDVDLKASSAHQNGYCESFNGSIRDELLIVESFTPCWGKTLNEAKRRHYNTVRPHSSLGYWPRVPETAISDLLQS